MKTEKSIIMGHRNGGRTERNGFMAVNTAYLCEEEGQGITILEYRSLDSLVAVPEQAGSRPVTALAPYLFSAHENYNDMGHPGAFWISESGRRLSREEAGELPVVKGDVLEELRLPSSLKQVGAYGLYNCSRLRKLELFSTTLDWGPGVFTGCQSVTDLRVHVDELQKSCLKEILAELRQTLTVTYDGEEKALLIFPEFFEEAVENTPARILVTNTHGCGQRYRNAFVQTRFQFQEYDSLFPHVQVQEPEELVTELALGRIMHPYHLSEEYKHRYMEYLKEHRTAAACQAVRRENMDHLTWLTEHVLYEKEDLKIVIETANRRGNMPAVSLLMNRARRQGAVKRRRFAL